MQEYVGLLGLLEEFVAAVAMKSKKFYSSENNDEKEPEKLATVQILSLDEKLVVSSLRGHVVIQYVRHHRNGSIGRRSLDQHEPFASSNTSSNNFDMMDVT